MNVTIVTDFIFLNIKGAIRFFNNRFFKRYKPWLIILLLLFFIKLRANELYIGATTVDITPVVPIALDGQMHLRIANTIETPLEANIVILETKNGNNISEIVIFISCDLLVIPSELLNEVKNEVKMLLPEIEVEKIVMNATHTHTAPVVRHGIYPIPKTGIAQIEEYYGLFIKQTSKAIEKAWNNRKPGSVTWGLGHAKIGHNRRAIYEDNSAKMYGQTDVPEFRTIEGPEDQTTNTLFFWNQHGNLIAVAIAVGCPSQEVESSVSINADYWHPVRQQLRKHFNPQLVVLGWLTASGDQSPHLMYGEAGEERMRNLRGLNRLEEIARRIVSVVKETYEVIKEDQYASIPIIHKKKSIILPMRMVTKSEFEKSKKEIEKLKAQISQEPKLQKKLYRRLNSFEGDVIRRYEQQIRNIPQIHEIQIHVIRIGDIVVCTNPFELFTDYGITMQARSKALQTFVLQLTGPGTYLPTEKAVKGGHYSAIVQSTLVGPEGGHFLVDQTVELINELF